MSAATRAPKTTASSSEFEASRLAPCKPGRRDFADRPEPRDAGASARIRGDAAHVVVLGRRDGDEIRDRVDAGGAAMGGDGRKGVVEARADGLAAIEERAAPGGDFGKHAAGDDVAGREFAARVDLAA